MLLDEVGLWFLASCLEGCQTIFFPPSCNKSLITWLSCFPGPLLAFVSIPVHLPLNERGAVQPKADLQVEWCAAYIIQELVWSSLEHMLIKVAWNYRFFFFVCVSYGFWPSFLTQNCPENSQGVIFPLSLTTLNFDTSVVISASPEESQWPSYTKCFLQHCSLFPDRNFPSPATGRSKNAVCDPSWAEVRLRKPSQRRLHSSVACEAPS